MPVLWIEQEGVVSSSQSDTATDIKPSCSVCGKAFRKGQRVVYEVALSDTGRGLSVVVPGSIEDMAVRHTKCHK